MEDEESHPSPDRAAYPRYRAGGGATEPGRRRDAAGPGGGTPCF